MSGRDRRRGSSVSPDDVRGERRKRRTSVSDSSNGGVEDRRPRKDHEDDRRARHRDRRQDRDESDMETGVRHHRRRHSPQRNGSGDRGDSRRSKHERTHTKERSRSPYRSRHRRRSVSPPAKKRRRSYSLSRSPPRKSRGPLPSQDESFRGEKALETGAEPPPEKQKPNFKPTGLLAKEANTVAGTTTVLKYHEPPEARKSPPKEAWRMYVFKNQDLVDTIYLHQRSVWLCGRDQKVTDLLLEHPSISKQHAVIQFRHVTKTNEYGDKSSKVKPYLIDLESANGTKMNGEKVEAGKFVELLDKDVLGFGKSEREYVLMLPPPGT